MRKEIRETVATVGVQASGGLVVVTGTRTQQRGDERLAGGRLPRRGLALIKPITPPRKHLWMIYEPNG